ncbi:MAG: carbon storage regulator [Gammaproteobacteria bacterium]|nr:carbon storage regulator [Gammaproteobacteria bacterium]
MKNLAAILIADDIKHHITIGGGKAKVQIDSPKHVKIQRGELLRWRIK